MIKCNVDSIESMGLKDGPGVRTVIFLQECRLRCKYCHNPEMWHKEKKTEYTVLELMEIVNKYKPYYKDNGGITVSGGEPILQDEFLIAFFKECRKQGIHTCLDTAGVGNGNYSELLEYTDLVLLDIKHTDRNSYKELVSHDIDESYKFIRACNRLDKKIWIRQVIIPGINDNIEYIHTLAKTLKMINNIEKIDLLPYHTMAIDKYKNLDIDYALKDTPGMDENKCNELYEELIRTMN